MDTVTKAKRSWNMSRIRSNDTKPEMVVRSFLHRQGFRFRLHAKTLPGHPDIVLPKYKTVVEVRGCFWHRHKGCHRATTPRSNLDYWLQKFDKNIKRDRENEQVLNAKGWKYLVVWECETTPKNFPPPLLLDFIKTAKALLKKSKKH